MKYHDRASLPAHGGKRQFMAPGGRFMAQNDPASLW
jgi:hypothetical protein